MARGKGVRHNSIVFGSLLKVANEIYAQNTNSEYSTSFQEIMQHKDTKMRKVRMIQMLRALYEYTNGNSLYFSHFLYEFRIVRILRIVCMLVSSPVVKL